MKTSHKLLENWIYQSLIALIFITSALPSRAIPFVINFAYPTNGTAYAAPANIGMNVRVTDSNTVYLVQYFWGTTLLSTITNSSGELFTNIAQPTPFFTTWSNVPAGSYSLTALAYDSSGNTATSTPVVVTVTNSTTAPPPSVPFTVSIAYPTNGQSFNAPANIYLHARVADSNLVLLVQYFADGSFIGSITNSTGVILTNSSQDNPFYMTWSNVPAGSYSLTALAIDNTGNTTTSEPVDIAVSNNVSPAAPFAISISSPTNGQRFPAPSNIGIHVAVTDSNVVELVQYFANSSFIGIATNSAGIIFTNSAQPNPFSITWSNVTAGSYSLTALAIDSMGNTTTSAPVSITVSNNATPVAPFAVAINYPTNGQRFLAPANIYLHAQVTDSNLVQLVQYFANGSFIGIVTNSAGIILTNSTQANPFYLTWSNVTAGSYSLTALAIDSMGNTATSAPVNITVSNNVTPVAPFAIAINYPTNDQRFLAPANIYLHAQVTDSNLVQLVQYFANGSFIGIATNSAGIILTNSAQPNPFSITWSNVTAGGYSLTALAIDSMGNTVTSTPVNIKVSNNVTPIAPFAIAINSPTNNERFPAPANIYLHSIVTDSNLVELVQYFANGSFIGNTTNSAGIILTNSAQANPFFMTWSNVPAGSYSLTARAIDSAGNTVTSAPVNITVSNNVPPVAPFAISINYPTNGQRFLAPANIYLHAQVTDSNLVQLVQYFANGSFIGTVTNKISVILTNSTQVNPFYMTWSNVPAGAYSLTALAVDSMGNTATSAPVNIVVSNVPPPVIPFAVNFWYPTNGQMFIAPANIGVHARVTDSNVVQLVQYFANGSFIGTVTNSTGVKLTNSAQANPFFLDWSNVPMGTYELTALAIDSAGNTATSGPVNIYVLAHEPPVVSIYAPDPVAVEGTNSIRWFLPSTAVTNYVSGTNTATFLIRRDSQTNTDLTVQYAIGGTASNGVDYVAIPNSVVIPAGQRYALITIIPLEDTDSRYRPYDNVILTLEEPTNNSTTAMALPYIIGNPRSAGAIILEENFLPIIGPIIHGFGDNSTHVSLPATNGLNYCLQFSPDLVNWTPVCTNTVLKGSAQFVDPGASTGTSVFYRIVPVNGPASY